MTRNEAEDIVSWCASAVTGARVPDWICGYPNARITEVLCKVTQALSILALESHQKKGPPTCDCVGEYRDPSCETHGIGPAPERKDWR